MLKFELRLSNSNLYFNWVCYTST